MRRRSHTYGPLRPSIGRPSSSAQNAASRSGSSQSTMMSTTSTGGSITTRFSQVRPGFVRLNAPNALFRCQQRVQRHEHRNQGGDVHSRSAASRSPLQGCSAEMRSCVALRTIERSAKRSGNLSAGTRSRAPTPSIRRGPRGRSARSGSGARLERRDHLRKDRRARCRLSR